MIQRVVATIALALTVFSGQSFALDDFYDELNDENGLFWISDENASIGDVKESINEDSNTPSVPMCTCFGGPGNYSHACAPVAKTCYGGPGNYPYTCWVCPQ